jgi:hypothetical protein
LHGTRPRLAACAPSPAQLAEEARRNALARGRIAVLGALSETFLSLQLLSAASPACGGSDEDRARAAAAAGPSLQRTDELMEAVRSAMAAAAQPRPPAAAEPALSAAGASSSAAGGPAGSATTSAADAVAGAAGAAAPAASGASGAVCASEASSRSPGAAPGGGGGGGNPFGGCLPASSFSRRWAPTAVRPGRPRPRARACLTAPRLGPDGAALLPGRPPAACAPPPSSSPRITAYFEDPMTPEEFIPWWCSKITALDAQLRAGDGADDAQFGEVRGPRARGRRAPCARPTPPAAGPLGFPAAIPFNLRPLGAPAPASLPPACRRCARPRRRFLASTCASPGSPT